MKHIAIGCLAGTVLLILALGGAAWYWLIRDVPLLDAALDLPSEARLDVPIELVVTVSNTYERTITMDSIDIEDSFMAGFQILSITPKEKSSVSTPFVKQRSWSFERPVRNRGVAQFVFELKPVLAGRFTGDVDVCNPNRDFHTLVADVVVREAADGTTEDDEGADE